MKSNLKTTNICLIKKIPLINNVPFDIINVDYKNLYKYENENYIIKVNTPLNASKKLISEIRISNVGDKSDILRLSHKSTNQKYSQLILNKLIDVYSNDGIRETNNYYTKKL